MSFKNLRHVRCFRCGRQVAEYRAVWAGLGRVGSGSGWLHKACAEELVEETEAKASRTAPAEEA